MNPNDDLISAFCAALPGAGYGGECALDMSTRLVHATDNSIYQLLPHAVLFPRSHEDVVAMMRLAQQPAFAKIAFTPRGGGTGTNGQSLNDTIIVDSSRYLRSILEINIVDGFVRVEPGVVLDELNAALALHGYFFPPDVSPSKSATLGGMVATDACGKGSTVYGKTGDYVLSVRAVMADGSVLDTHTHSDNALQKIISSDYAAALDGVPELPRGLSAYNIRGALNAQTGALDFNRLLAGSEGTLAITTEIKLKIIPLPLHKAMVAIAYDDFDKALRHVGALLRHQPTAVETIDNHILDLARGDVVWHGVSAFFPGVDLSGVRAMHFVEFEKHSRADLVAALDSLTKALATDAVPTAFFPTVDARHIQSIKDMRKKCVGLLGNMAGNRRPIPFMEDTAVPPHRLADYISELRAFLSSHGLDCGIFGHSDAGCLHTRPTLDLRDVGDEKFIRTLTDGAVTILKKYGGVLWGEHGKGMRAAYSAQILGTAYYALMQKIKNHLDPNNRLNPGKVAAPPGYELYAIDGVAMRGQMDRQIAPKYLERFPKATQCNGNGLCFSVMPDDTMCPSYKVTRDRRHSPKGRAALLREWLRLKSTDVHAANRFAPRVKAALDGCLSCKACTSTCPIHVNIPDMKADFAADYYRTRIRPMRDYMIAMAEWAAPFLSRLPFALPNCFGLQDMPRPPRQSLAAMMRVDDFAFATPENIVAANHPVLIVQDAYSSHYEPHVVMAMLRLLRHIGKVPLVVPFFQSGKSFHVQGFLKTFARIAARNDAHLSALAQHGAPMVGIDPSMTIVFRDEYPKVLGRQVNYRVQMIQEYLAGLDSLPRAGVGGEFSLLLHCTEKTAVPASANQWRDIFTATGLQLAVRPSGCCGMAGAYGHMAEHQETSRALFDLTWRGAVGDKTLATGFSCRSQTKRLAAQQLLHPVEVLCRALEPIK